MDVSSISTAFASAKALKEIVQAMAQLTVANESLGRINEARTQVDSLLDSLFQAREDLFRLQSENQELKQKIAVHDAWEKEMARYKLVTTAGGATVFESVTDSPKHFVCPTCFANKTIIPLQTNDGYYFGCPSSSCKNTLYKVKEPPPVRVQTQHEPW